MGLKIFLILNFKVISQFYQATVLDITLRGGRWEKEEDVVGVLRLPFHQRCILPTLAVVVISPTPYFVLENVLCRPRENR